MAEETSVPTNGAIETSPMAEEVEAPSKLADAPKEEEEEEEAKEIEAETKEIVPLASDHKRKLEDLEGEGGEKKDEASLESNEKKNENEAKIDNDDDGSFDVKRQRVDGDAEGLDADESQDIPKEVQAVGNGQLPHSENIESGPVQNYTESVPLQDVLSCKGQQDAAQSSTESVPRPSGVPTAGQQETSRKIEVANNKVGVLIGKSGETIRLLQNNSGARIQITKDAEANSNSSTRPVEITGTLENINKAEQLIKDVIAEAAAGGSPSLVARGFGAIHSGSEVHEMQVPSGKVGWIIGKGGETIKTLQTKSQARIQLIPQHLPEGDFSKERTIRITGNKKQIEAAKILIKDVMNQQPGKQSNLYGQSHGYRPPRGHSMQSQWGPRGAPPIQSQMQPNAAYDYPQSGGTYQQPQNTQYPQQSYGSGGYPQQPAQRPAAAPVQTPPGGSYDYYGQGQAMGTQPSSYPSSGPTSAPPVNYNNYGQPQPAGGYGHQPNPYPQSAPPQQSYGGYDNQAPYGQQQQQQPGGYYSQQGSTAPGYAQQQPAGYGNNAAAAAYAGAPPQSAYGPPPNQGPVSSSYGSGGPTTQQQPYPYGSSTVPTSQPAAYGQGYGPTSADGYNQAAASAAATVGGYSQPPSYGQGYSSQPGGAGGYGQYPPQAAQPPAAGYGDQSVPPANNVNYGYQGGVGGGGYGSSAPPPSSGGYSAAAPASAPAPAYGGYAQPLAAAANYDQSAAGYGGAPPVGYAKGVSPQPAGAAAYGGGGQYDSVPPMYGGHH